MILHPGILALILGTALVLFMLLYASGLAVKIIRRWDFDSSSEGQLNLERKTYLVSTIVNYALGFEIFSLILFVYTLDEIHGLFVGAMCATGVLNANPVGWYALILKIVIFFAAALWVAVNYLDGKTENLPLTRIKFTGLLLLTPLVGGELYLKIHYFLGLEPEVITSCCGSLFSADGTGVAAELAGLPVVPMMSVFYGLALLLLLCALPCLKERATAVFCRLFSLLAAVFFVVALMSIVSFISLYIYELPTHHCPFDIVQKNYGFIGYPLYLTLFAGTLFGIMPGILRPVMHRTGLGAVLGSIERKWILVSLALLLIFVLMVSWPILFGSFKLAGYPGFF
ncbi:hypothetical protein MJO47_10380 [Desulfuromonas sp. KJ2020]|uniref:hypothetical protein n=1 Tax=Desulfuromonas sp. KJ2020 TaxID=2919173 RepID=UPI0020A82C16|nr:hypothetical protein [Desulfuromonas sp. KJ2020]MCP3177507.1 hypothetical protein [Desulfuromonas sp. KJ2020]